MRLRLLSPGKTKNVWFADGIGEYVKRLRGFGGLEIVYTKDAGRGQRSDAEKKDREGEYMLAAVDKGSLLVALDAAGEQCTSEEFAKLLSRWEMQGRKRVVFLVGGHLGLAPAVLQCADLRLSLSKMTFPHELARLLLVEQIYRAFTIKQGTGYHK